MRGSYLIYIITARFNFRGLNHIHLTGAISPITNQTCDTIIVPNKGVLVNVQG